MICGVLWMWNAFENEIEQANDNACNVWTENSVMKIMLFLVICDCGHWNSENVSSVKPTIP